jgi:hypothetical protein
MCIACHWVDEQLVLRMIIPYPGTLPLHFSHPWVIFSPMSMRNGERDTRWVYHMQAVQSCQMLLLYLYRVGFMIIRYLFTAVINLYADLVMPMLSSRTRWLFGLTFTFYDCLLSNNLWFQQNLFG